MITPQIPNAEAARVLRTLADQVESGGSAITDLSVEDWPNIGKGHIRVSWKAAPEGGTPSAAEGEAE